MFFPQRSWNKTQAVYSRVANGSTCCDSSWHWQVVYGSSTMYIVLRCHWFRSLLLSRWRLVWNCLGLRRMSILVVGLQGPAGASGEAVKQPVFFACVCYVLTATFSHKFFVTEWQGFISFKPRGRREMEIFCIFIRHTCSQHCANMRHFCTKSTTLKDRFLHL